MTMQVCAEAFNNEDSLTHFWALYEAIIAPNELKVLRLCMRQITQHTINFTIDGSTLLHKAVESSNPVPPIVQHLLVAGFNANALNDQGLTALELAVEQNCQDIIFLLINKTCITEQMLERALQRNYTNVVTLLQLFFPTFNQQGLFREQVSQNPRNPGSTFRPNSP